MISKWDGVRVTPEEAQIVVNIAEAVGLKVCSPETKGYSAIYYDGEILAGANPQHSLINWLTFKQFINKMVTKEPKFQHGQKFKDKNGIEWRLNKNANDRWSLETVTVINCGYGDVTESKLNGLQPGLVPII